VNILSIVLSLDLAALAALAAFVVHVRRAEHIVTHVSIVDPFARPANVPADHLPVWHREADGRIVVRTWQANTAPAAEAPRFDLPRDAFGRLLPADAYDALPLDLVSDDTEPEHTHECRECRADIVCCFTEEECRWPGGNDGCGCADAVVYAAVDAAVDALATGHGPVLAACIPAAQTYAWMRRGIGRGPAAGIPAVDALAAVSASYPGGIPSFTLDVLAPSVAEPSGDVDPSLACGWCDRAAVDSPTGRPSDLACRLHAATYFGAGVDA